MPREAWALSPEDIVIREVDTRQPGDTEVRVRSRFAAAKHGTELAMIKGYGRQRGIYDDDLGLFLRQETPGKPTGWLARILTRRNSRNPAEPEANRTITGAPTRIGRQPTRRRLRPRQAAE